MTVASAIAVAPDSSAQTTGGGAGTALRAVTVVPSKDGATVVIEANGTLPPPSSGFVNNPSRVYIDFTNVLPGQPIQPAPANPLVRRVRVAEHNSSPLVTRVVIDLTGPTAYRIDSSNLAQGRVTVTLGGTDSATPPRAQSPAPPAHASSSAKPQPPAAGRGPGPVPREPRDGISSSKAGIQEPISGRTAAENAYGVRVSAALVRLHALRPLLESIDRQADPLQGNLDAAVSELQAIGKLLDGIRAPRTREGTHALLQRTCTMGVRAVRMRQDGARTNDAAAVVNAASAAAGALLMLDRANRELAGENRK
jgi:AMIN domain